MMTYTREKNTQLLISLLKQHGVRYVVASPGNTNTAFIGSIQGDQYFTIFSAVDERSAAYMACGIAAETGETVVISCTGATASRNYLPGMTEAYYRKLPVIAVTSSQPIANIGHLSAQLLDRTVIPKDVAKLSVNLPIVKDNDDVWECEIKINQAILESCRHGGGPVHINLPTTFTKPFDVNKIQHARLINRVTIDDQFPLLEDKKVAIFIGSHKKMSKDVESLIDRFCEENNSVVFCDHTSAYKGKYRVHYSLVSGQEYNSIITERPDILIHFGEVTGDYYNLKIAAKEQVWRVSDDGEIRDSFRKLRYVFEMSLNSFFLNYVGHGTEINISYYETCKAKLDQVRNNIPEIPFSNIWAASQVSSKLPDHSVIHFGILNSLRSWNFFDIPDTVTSDSNVGGFGIDGNMSSLIGASLTNPEKLYFLVNGDLAFFYDLNVLGNRHVGANIRILLVNNGKGTEFRQYNHHANYFGEDTDKYIAAAGHFGNKSKSLVKCFVENLGFEYICASDKQEFLFQIDRFVTKNVQDRPMVFEIFTNSNDESCALEKMLSIDIDKKIVRKNKVKSVVGTSVISSVKKILGS
ncbi:2-succinyl-6-hydroxy-2,4-cyclohexadiene-1-carboxylate synthase [Shewanella loihica PV-4]|uniref:2-succinyl-6-hydroxy-2, 4-cyclohexadiene-1-carboxylate synthase n=2 Tax=Shewanella TaxID=22 RepID=A3QCS9_SHELP|nr:2-succinyl-6-hydroxy-2,4-cyclohexadiene-1-carboxylate synthase [Shewanella loihica PV-4]